MTHRANTRTWRKALRRAFAAAVVAAVAALPAGCAQRAPQAPDRVLTPSLVPEKALADLSASLDESCGDCAVDMIQSARKLLDTACRPGTDVQSVEGCPFVVEDPAAHLLRVQCLPGSDGFAVFLRFHTVKNHLVGVAPEDLTTTSAARPVEEAAPGTRLAGRVRLIPYEYGDGPTYLIQPYTRRLVIHCRIEDLAPEGA